MNNNDCVKIKETAATRARNTERLCMHLENRKSLLLYGPTGIGKKTLVNCLAYEFCQDATRKARFYRVDPTTQLFEKWESEKCRWRTVEQQVEQDSLTLVEGTLGAIANVRSDNQIVADRKEQRSEREVLIDRMLARVEQEMGEQGYLQRNSQDYYVLYIVTNLSEVPLSDFSFPQIGTLVAWIRKGVSLILLHKENLSDTSKGFGGLYGRDTDRWTRDAVGLFESKENTVKAALQLYKEKTASSEAGADDKLLDAIASVAGPYPGQIAFAAECLAPEWLSKSAEDIRDMLKGAVREKYKVTFLEIWEDLGKEEKQVLAVAAMLKLGKAQDDEIAEKKLLEQCPDCSVAMPPGAIKEIREQLASPRRRYGQLVLPWSHAHAYSDSSAEFILDQLPHPVQRKPTEKIFRRDVMLFFVSLVTLFGFVSIFLSLIDNALLISIIVLVLLVALVALIVYAVLFFIRAVRS